MVLILLTKYFLAEANKKAQMLFLQEENKHDECFTRAEFICTDHILVEQLLYRKNLTSVVTLEL